MSKVLGDKIRELLKDLKLMGHPLEELKAINKELDQLIEAKNKRDILKTRVEELEKEQSNFDQYVTEVAYIMFTNNIDMIDTQKWIKDFKQLKQDALLGKAFRAYYKSDTTFNYSGYESYNDFEEILLGWHKLQLEKEDFNKNSKQIQVCDKCLKASCWYGEFLCEESYGAGVTTKTVEELTELKLESSDYWSDEYMRKIYGEHNPFGYREVKL